MCWPSPPPPARQSARCHCPRAEAASSTACTASTSRTLRIPYSRLLASIENLWEGMGRGQLRPKRVRGARRAVDHLLQWEGGQSRGMDFGHVGEEAKVGEAELREMGDVGGH